MALAPVGSSRWWRIEFLHLPLDSDRYNGVKKCFKNDIQIRLLVERAALAALLLGLRYVIERLIPFSFFYVDYEQKGRPSY